MLHHNRRRVVRDRIVDVEVMKLELRTLRGRVPSPARTTVSGAHARTAFDGPRQGRLTP